MSRKFDRAMDLLLDESYQDGEDFQDETREENIERSARMILEEQI